ncbi:hypothetical protein [Vagococcus fluvialis]|uniref:hypothetical protein n=1 Tax=Vagococcus fluvialis TaxID=2738 RepID=UPI001D0ADEAB|nr:hypothetical protein [Vagococcus fluvialis]UDM71556.1 hypothetical protein K5L00_01995 [Vagococcus fluvialis]UDM76417.1 hypothetical protein K5K98_11795 [Vagococcus fluvialis]UDM83247.1 hypothetical protein K5K96_04475 [Vagococcus fluvialis]
MVCEANEELITQIVLEVYKQLKNKKNNSTMSSKETEEISYLSVGTMARLANGNPMNEEEDVLFKKLIKGENIVIKEENIEFLNVSIKPKYKLNNLLHQQLQILKEYGLVVKKKENKMSNNYYKQLFTLEKIKALQLSKGELFLKKESDIITPLAIDYLNQQKIKIEVR